MSNYQHQFYRIKMLRKISIILIVTAFLVSFSFCYKSIGFNEGYELAQKEYEESTKEKIQMSGGIDSIYEHLAYRYSFICWMLVILFACKFFEITPAYNHKEGYISANGLCFLSIFIVLYQLWRMLLEKYFISQTISWETEYTTFIRSSYLYDWLILVLTITLLILQVISFAQLFLKTGTKQQ